MQILYEDFGCFLCNWVTRFKMQNILAHLMKNNWQTRSRCVQWPPLWWLHILIYQITSTSMGLYYSADWQRNTLPRNVISALNFVTCFWKATFTPYSTINTWKHKHTCLHSRCCAKNTHTKKTTQSRTFCDWKFMRPSEEMSRFCK